MLAEDLLILAGVPILILEIILIAKKVNIKKNVLIILLLIYITLVIAVTLFPIYYDNTGVAGYAYNFIPFAGISDAFKDGLSVALRVLGGNFILLMPLGYLVPFLQKPTKNLLKTFVIIIAVAFAIELTQHLIGLMIGYRYRNVDVDDFILNRLYQSYGQMQYVNI